MFEEMLKPAKEWLKGRNPNEIARRAGVQFDESRSEFRFSGLNQEICISWPNLEIRSELSDWHRLVMLHYLHLADGISLHDDWIALGSMRDGMIRGGDFDAQCAQELARILKDRTEDELWKVFEALGGRMVDSNADLCAVLPFLPRFPLMLKVWLADDEMDVSVRLLVNGAADHYLTVEDAVTVGSIVLETLKCRLGC